MFNLLKLNVFDDKMVKRPKKRGINMDKKLSINEYIILASMLFGMFFGAGNLVFPVSMGQQAGANLWPAIIGFCLTGVGIPLLGIAAMGISRSEGLFDMCCRIGKPYAYFFTQLLYLFFYGSWYLLIHVGAFRIVCRV